MEKEILIEVRDLHIGYDGRTVQKDLNFTVKKGEIFVILGGSGCGKSTLLKHLIGLYKPMAGDILINNRNIAEAKVAERRKIMQSFGVLYQSAALFGSMTLAENISLVLEEFTNLSKAQREQRIDEKLSLVKLQEFRDFVPSEISGGMKKRAGLARAMALNPPVLFFDEPSAGLDPISSAQLDKLMLELRDKFNTTMVVVTHELDSIFTIADRVIVLSAKEKTMVEEGDPRLLRKRSRQPWVKEFLNRSGEKHI
jgi:phospholipid/cholesterol/gamma-HCH transport system ATP-binding protein